MGCLLYLLSVYQPRGALVLFRPFATHGATTACVGLVQGVQVFLKVFLVDDF